MAVQVLGVPTTQGLPRNALRHGPEALRAAGLIRRLERTGSEAIDLGDLDRLDGVAEETVPERMARVVRAAERQAGFWQAHHRPGDLMLTLGGDHAASLGTIQALREMGHDFDIVWIDAHGDFNSPDTSPSGNPHGMVLALACGLVPDHLGRLADPASVHLWGIRDLDPGEQELLLRERVEVLSPDQLRHEWNRVIRRLKSRVFVSFDIDAVEPAEAPGTMTPVPGGLHRFEALDLIAAIARQRHLLALDIVEYHPDRDRHNLTADLALQVIEAAVTGRAAQSSRSGGSAAAAGN